MNALWKDVLEALESALPIIQFDAQMMADITRHAPLDPESQAKHDSTEYASEHLVRTIPPLIERLKAALAEPQPEPYCYIYEYDSVLGLHREFYPRQWNGYLPSRVVTLYAAPTAQQPLTDEQIDAIPCTDGDGSDWAWESCDDAMEAMSCPWCDRQDIDICQHADDAKNCEKTK